MAWKKVFLGLLLLHVISAAGPSKKKLANFAYKCGQRQAIRGNIYRGNETVRGTHPWAAALLIKANHAFFCSGSLISKLHVLTVAHCIKQKSGQVSLQPDQIMVAIGKHNLKLSEEDAKIYDVVKILIHPEWSTNTTKYDADIAILELSREVIFNSFIQPICLPTLEEKNFEELGIVIGWGVHEKSKNTEASAVLREAQILSVANDRCYESNKNLVDLSSPRTFCAGMPENQIGACPGDSGGGFFVFNHGVYILRGMVSSALINSFGPCNAQDYAVYTNVAAYFNWIKEMLEPSNTIAEFVTLECGNVKDCSLIDTNYITNRGANICGRIEENQIGFPWAVAIIDRQTKQLLCMGTLVNNINVVTAADCIHPRGQSDMKLGHELTVSLGKYDMQKAEENSKSADVLYTTIHPNWNPETLNYGVDIAILTLTSELYFTKAIRPVCLPDELGTNLTNSGIVLSWTQSPILRSTELAIAPNANCQNSNEILNGQKFCAGREGGTCSSGAGGGLYNLNGDIYRLSGILSSTSKDPTRQCNSRDFSLFTSVVKNIKWIEDVITDRNVEIQCDFTQSNDDDYYTCNVKKWNVISHNHQLRAVLGHAKGKHNVNVEAIFIQDEPEFQAIPKKVGDIFSNLKAFNITNSPLTYIVRDQFRNMKFLTRLCLINTKIRYIPEDAFTGLSNMKALYINGNRIEKINRKMLNHFKQLRRLSLNNNRIRELPADVFTELYGVWNIFVGGNLLTTLPVDVFKPVKQIKGIFLNDNQLEFIHADLFKHNRKLERVNLSGNRLTRIDFDFTPLSELILVQLDGNICIDQIYALKTEEMQNDIRSKCTGAINVQTNGNFANRRRHQQNSHPSSDPVVFPDQLLEIKQRG